jgi:hypothetical protein
LKTPHLHLLQQFSENTCTRYKDVELFPILLGQRKFTSFGRCQF